MKKLLILFALLIIAAAASAQTYALRGLVVGDPIANMATIDSIKIDATELKFYTGGSVIPIYISSYDHYALNGLGADDHTHYYNSTRIASWFATQSVAGLGTNDHDLLGGLADDDHTQYYNSTRLNAWTGSSSITTLGTITTGTWQGTDIANGFIVDALTGKTYNGISLSTAGAATVYLDGTGNYSTPASAVTSGMQDSLDWVYEQMEDSIRMESVAPLLSDSVSFPFGMGYGLPSDTAGCYDEVILGGWYNEQDTVVALKTLGTTKRTGSSVGVDIYYSQTDYLSATRTLVCSLTLTPTTSTNTTFETGAKFIPPNSYIWAEIDGTPTDANKCTHLKLDFLFAKIRQE